MLLHFIVERKICECEYIVAKDKNQDFLEDS